jgi:hypothetical protein
VFGNPKQQQNWLLFTSAATGPCEIANSNNQSVSCTGPGGTPQALDGFACSPGYYLVNNTAPIADSCEPCNGIANSNNVSITCTDATNSQGSTASGFQCFPEFFPDGTSAPIKCTRMVRCNSLKLIQTKRHGQ